MNRNTNSALFKIFLAIIERPMITISPLAMALALDLAIDPGQDWVKAISWKL